MRALATQWLLSVWVTAAPALATAQAPVQQGVTLSGQTASVAAVAGKRLLRVTLDVHNNLPTPLEGIEVGILFAASPQALQGARPSQLYLAAPVLHGPLGALWRELPVQAAPGSARPVVIEQELHPTSPEPVTFYSHVLGYALAPGADWPLLRGLLASERPADERAACTYFALLQPPERRQAVRERLAHDLGLRRELAAELRRPIERSPAQAVAFVWALAVRAMGVLGGPDALELLASLRERGDVPMMDEPLQILRVAREVGSLLETPLAFAVPAHVQNARELVVAALGEARGEWVPHELPAASRFEPPPGAVGIEPGASVPGRAGLLIALGLLAVLATAWIRRRRGRGRTQREGE